MLISIGNLVMQKLKENSSDSEEKNSSSYNNKKSSDLLQTFKKNVALQLRGISLSKVIVAYDTTQKLK